MKKNILKLLCALSIGINILLCNFQTTYAQDKVAWDYRFTNNYTTSKYVDSSRWSYNQYDKTWSVSTPDFDQVEVNSWVLTNGKWYFINQQGVMVTNCLVRDGSKQYYMQDDGSLLTNGYCKYGVHTSVITAYADANGVLTDISSVDESK